MRDIGTTISGMTGRGSIRHNNREFTAANVDRERSAQNVVFVNENLKQVYHELFDEALETYNAGKKKTRDKIPDYYKHIQQSKQEKLFHEAIFQIGNLNDCGCGSEGGQRAAEVLTEFAKTFQARNPHLRVFNMVLHMDEATPHLHVDFVPVATEQTRGLSTRVSMKQALKQQGFTGLGRKQTEWKAWMEREKDALTEIAQRHEFEIISLGSNRRHMDLPEYRAAIREAEAVQEQTAAATQELTDLQEQRTELKREIMSLSGASAALKAAERVRVDFDTIRPEKTLTGAVKGVTVEQIRELKAAAMTGAAALLALGLTGCGATLGGGAQSEEAAASADNQLCVIPRTPTPQLLEAVSAGLKTAGYEVKVLPEDAKTDACDHCVLYGLMLNEKRDGVKAFVFQSFKNGQPELAANAPVENNQVNLQQVAQYAVEFAAALKKNAEAGGTPAAR